MKRETLKSAISEAERFIATAKEALIREYRESEHYRKMPDVCYSKEAASCKRSSLDLTRKLADLRLGR
jgi:hypothetical protein